MKQTPSSCLRLQTVLLVCCLLGLALWSPGPAAAGIGSAADAALTSITPDEIEGAAVPQTKLFTILGTGLGFGKAQVVFTGPREDTVRTVFAFALNTRVLAIAVIAANPEPGTYAVTVKRGAIEAAGVSLTITGDNDTTTTTIPGGASRCIPCGDFMPVCDVRCAATINPEKKCPACYSIDNSTVLLKFDDGSYYVTETDPVTGKVITTYYDNTGKVCFSFETTTKESTLYDRSGEVCYTIKGTSSGDAQLILNDKTYTIHKDGSWTCPDGTTWTMPESCTDSLIDTGNEGCPATLPPPCTQ